MPKIFIIFLLIFPVFVLGYDLEVQDFIENQSLLASNPNLILFKAAVFDPLAESLSEKEFGLSSFRDKNEGDILYVVQFLDVPQDSDREEIIKEGGKIISYIPNNAYLVMIDSEKFQNLSYKENVRTSFRLPKWAKIDPELFEIKEDTLEIDIFPIPGSNSLGIADFLFKEYPEIKILTKRENHEKGWVTCAVSYNLISKFLDSISGLEEVLWVTKHFQPKLINDDSIWVIQNYDTTNKRNYNLSATIWNKGIIGTGQIGALIDSGLTNTACQFRYNGTSGSQANAQSPTPPDPGNVDMSKKVIAYYLLPDAASYDHDADYYHGSHTAGTLAGDNYATLSTPTSHGHDSGDGMAPNAKLIMQDCDDGSGNLPCHVQNYYRQAYNAGARVHSNSWAAQGTGSNGYLVWSQQVDEVAYEKENFTIVCGQNNSGCSLGSMGSPATAKNVVSVGASTNGLTANGDNRANFSGNGPTTDGRLKPDVIAPGGSDYNCTSGINSADGNAKGNPPCGAKQMCGTSKSTPTVAGALLLMRQYFMDGWYPSGTKVSADTREPSSALLKACLINGAVPLGGTEPCTGQPAEPPPTMRQGWGRIHLENSLYFSGDNRRLRVWDVKNANGLKTGEYVEYPIYVSSNTVPLKVHLVWTDPESNPLAAVNLVNNLDLEVKSPSGTIYKGNVFSNGQSTTGGSADALNNVEGFILNNPPVGTWTLKVKATSVPGNGKTNRQGYALVATYSGCTSTLSAPANLNAIDNGTTGINLFWDNVSGAEGYLIYRAQGSNPPADQYALIAQVFTTAYLDTDVTCGFTYSYKVRATDNCAESGLSNKATATYTGNCTLKPTFGGLVSVVNDTSTQYCDLVLSWNAGTSNCPLGQQITYAVYRSTSPYFTPNSSTLLAKGITGTTYRDYYVQGLTTYYYIVKAEDSTTQNEGPNNGGNLDVNNVVVKGTPWSSSTTFGTFNDDGGDTNAKINIPLTWRVTNQQNHTSEGYYCYHNTLDGQDYPQGECSAAVTPPLLLGSNSVLSYWVRYNMEYGWDGVVVEISTNGGSSWTIITPNGGYPASFGNTGNPPVNACGYASTVPCFSGPIGNTGLNNWTQYTHNLSSYAGQTVLIRWPFSSDYYTAYEGFYLDDVTITNAYINNACLPFDGIVELDRISYPCSGSAQITVTDGHLVGSGSISVNIKSTTENLGETVILYETPPNSGILKGSINLTTSNPPSPGQLSIKNGDTITATYVDSDDGHGGTNVIKTDTANVDCIFSVISNVQILNRTYNSVTIVWNTNEPTNSRVTFGTSKPPTTNQDDSYFVTDHSITLTGLSVCTTYYFSVTSADPAENTVTDNNGGQYYSFTTTGFITLFSDDVESGTGTWTAQNQWHRSNCRSHSGSWAWRCAAPTSCSSTYDVDSQSTLTSGPINLGPPGHGCKLSYWQWVKTGYIIWHRLWITVSMDGGQSWTLIKEDFAYEQQYWMRQELDLSQFYGEVLIRFTFLDISGGYPPAEGWYLDDIEITRNAECLPDFKLLSNSFTDTCTGSGSGNNDGVLDPGEEGILQITLSNVGMQNATNVVGTLSTTSSGVLILDDTASFSNISSGGSGSSIAPHFKIAIFNNVPCYTNLQFNLFVVSAENPSGSNISFTLKAGRSTQVVTVYKEDFKFTMWPPNNTWPPGWTSVIVSGVHPWLAGWSCLNTGPYLKAELNAPPDAWMFSPGFQLNTGTVYTFRFRGKNQHGPTYPYSLEVKAGNAQSISAITIPIWSGTVTENTCSSTWWSGTFTVPSNGTYYIGFHGWATHFQWALFIDDLFLEYTIPSSCNQCTPFVHHLDHQTWYLQMEPVQEMS